jgi:hypothetical protein
MTESPKLGLVGHPRQEATVCMIKQGLELMMRGERVIDRALLPAHDENPIGVGVWRAVNCLRCPRDW